jgi:hypothetical protein
LNTSKNRNLSDKLEHLGLKIPTILLPKKGTDLSTWSVVACDQYTSDHEYWERVEKCIGTTPSTLRLTLPEIYLESEDVETRIKNIHASMKSYLESGTLEQYGETVVYIERYTEASGLRQGLLFAMDLERYDYARDSKTLIRATEGTIVERIPPRLRVRKEAFIELPHIMILINDPGKRLIEGAAASLKNKQLIYKTDLMENGGSLSGWGISDPASIENIADLLIGLLDDAKKTQHTDTPLFFAMGDGNHSLATAKAHWVATKQALIDSGIPEDEVMSHPARYALAEIVNIHSPGLRFEPINRAIFSSDITTTCELYKKHPLVASAVEIDETKLKKVLSSPDGQTRAGLWDGSKYFILEFINSESKLPPAFIDEIFASLSKDNADVNVDFIHGWEDTKKLSNENALGCFVPVIARERLFQWVSQHGPLPRKAFSMGDAEEKKYYMECRKIK